MKNYKPLYDKAKELIAEQRKLIYELDRQPIYGLDRQPNAIGKEWRERVEGIEININDLKSELAALEAEIEKEEQPKIYSSCKHPKKYHFLDRDGKLRCSDCHKVIE